MMIRTGAPGKDATESGRNRVGTFSDLQQAKTRKYSENKRDQQTKKREKVFRFYGLC